MAFVYQPNRKTVSVWRPVEFMVSTVMANVDAELIKVKILRGGELKSSAPVLFREFYVSNGEIDGGLRKFKFSVSPYLRDGVELFDGVKPHTMARREDLGNELEFKRANSVIPFKIEVRYYVKDNEGRYEESNLIDNYPMGGNEWMYGVNHSPNNGEDMYMGSYYPLVGVANFLTNGKGFFKCNLNESLFLSFWVGDNLVEALRVRRYQRNGHILEGFYGWSGLQDWSGDNYKVLVSNVGVTGINGLLGLGMSGLVEGSEVFIDRDTVKYEVQFISNVSEIFEDTSEGLTNGDITYAGFGEITETVTVRVDVCEDLEIFKRVHWMNRFGGMDSRTFKIFARRVVRVKSSKDRKSLRWRGSDLVPNERDFRSVVRRKIDSEVMYEVEEIVDNDEAIWLEGLLESPCVYMEDDNGFVSMGIEDGDIEPSDTDNGMRVIKLKFVLDNVKIGIE